MKVTGKKLFLFGFIALLLVGIPASVYLLGQQQEVRSRAEKATNISFSPVSSASAPIQKQIGDSVPLDIMIDPGKNLVSFIKLEIQYDPDKLATVSANAFQPNTAVFPSVLEGPVYTPGKIAVTLSVGSDPTKAIQTAVKAGTLTFTAVNKTGAGTPTLVTYSATTQALSIGPNDQASENVLASTTPATIIIEGEAAPTDIPNGPTATPLPTQQPTDTPNQPTATPLPTSTPFPTNPPDNSGGNQNQSPVCESLSVDRETTGAAPYSITFTANGTDSDGTISKVTFNFGDGGAVSDVTTGGGIGTNTVNAQIAHTYNNAGTFEATAIITDSNNAVSQSTTCKQTVIITDANGATAEPAQTAQATPSPTIGATGSTEVVFGLGALAFILMVGGSLVFFIL